MSTLDRPKSANPHASTLLERLTTRKARIGIIGMGYVGQPLAMAANKAGLHRFNPTWISTAARHASGIMLSRGPAVTTATSSSAPWTTRGKYIVGGCTPSSIKALAISSASA